MTKHEFANCSFYPSWRYVSLTYERHCDQFVKAAESEVNKRADYFAKQKNIQTNKRASAAKSA